MSNIELGLRVSLLGAGIAILSLAFLALLETRAKPMPFPLEAELEMALSAAPKPLRAQAGAYVLGKNGFVLVKKSSNGFICIVNREPNSFLKPTCYDREGTEAILPKMLRVGELMMKGVATEQIRADIAEGYRNGKYFAPRRPGIAYILSDDAPGFGPGIKRLEASPPIVMSFPSLLSHEEIASAGDFAMGLPSMKCQCRHGYRFVATPPENL